MRITFRFSAFVCTMALSWLLIQEAQQAAGSFPLPDPIKSNHIKNQSLVDCLDKYDPTTSIKGTPNNPICNQLVLGKASFTPQVDIVSLVCYGKISLDGQVLASVSIGNVCDVVKEIKCPMLKGVLQEFQYSYPMPCDVSQGFYKGMGHCTNQDDVTVVCGEYSGFWGNA